ncbi:MAG TPA: thymidylate kinase [Planctomycetaceae bacterium]|nr:thymidylate kinase [Planctomycetaceae bacterium]
MLIAIEGIDGSGKGTQAQRLVERLTSSGRRAALLSFPRYDATFFGRAVGEFLNGRFGTLAEAHPFLVSLLYAGDRFESRELLSELAAHNDVVVLDRYVPSNIAHQAAKRDGGDRERLIEWIEHLEYAVYGLPRADRVFLLDLPVWIARSLIARKQARSYTHRAADLQEADAAYLERVRELYLELAGRSPEWRRIEVSHEGVVRSIEEVADEVWTGCWPGC